MSGIPTTDTTAHRPLENSLTPRAGFLRLKSALHDQVTGLDSYHLYIDQLSMSADRRPLAVIVLEFPGLADLESTHGWEVSDRLLAGMSAFIAALRGSVIPASALMALDGAHGSTFFIFLHEALTGEDLTEAAIREITNALGQHLAAKMESGERLPAQARVEFLLGHSLLSPNLSSRFERRLYEAIYQARDMSRPTPRARDERTRELLSILSEARLTTHYQPIVDMERDTIMGYEALTRGPSDSIFEVPEALFSGSHAKRVLSDLDILCRHQAVRNARGFDPALKLFLNSLPETLGAPGHSAQDLLGTLEEVALRPRNLVLEITERSAIRDFEAFGRGLAPLRRQGFLVAIDDVGTGYSSLQTISEVQPDFIKVDISLIKNIHRSLIKQELVHSLLQVAFRIGAQVIAEGVETEEEFRALRRCGVRYGQGFLFAAPAPPFPSLAERGGGKH